MAIAVGVAASGGRLAPPVRSTRGAETHPDVRAHADERTATRRRYHRGVAMTQATATTRRSLELEAVGLAAAACLFNGFSDPSRLTILRHLTLGEHRVVDLTAHLNLAQSTVSKHLACLRDCGLVASRPEGRASVFSLTHPEAVLELFSAAERLLSLTGEAVTLCPTYGTTTIEGAR